MDYKGYTIKTVEGFRNNSIVVKSNNDVVHKCKFNSNKNSVLPSKQKAKEYCKHFIDENLD